MSRLKKLLRKKKNIKTEKKSWKLSLKYNYKFSSYEAFFVINSSSLIIEKKVHNI